MKTLVHSPRSRLKWLNGFLLASGSVVGLYWIGSSPLLLQGAAGPVVSVTGGQVEGRFLPSLGGAVFKGIPYAAPPVGDLRWRETQPVKPWMRTLEADRYGAPCPQVPAASERSKALAAASNEDCLFLNVWAPEWPSTTKKPVMMFLHGGDLFNNSGEGDIGLSPPYNGAKLARYGVVVVTINYRMGLLGMIGHPELTAESPHHASGNYGMLDQIAALKWVHDNIAAFGGDSGNVTVFGQSGGARFISMLLTSPLAKGLIHRAIIESGKSTAATRPYLTSAQLEELGVVLAEVLKVPSTGAISYLRSLPASQIVAAQTEVRKRLDAMDHLAYDMGVDGYVIPKNPAEVYRSHEELPVPLIIGNNALDGTGVVDLASPPLAPSASKEEKLTRMKEILQIFYGDHRSLLEQAVQFYGANGGPGEVSTYPPYGSAQDQMGVDFNHRCGSVVNATWHSNIAPTFQYEFTRSTPGHPPLHESELRFVWDSLGNEESDTGARELSDAIETYWTNFAKAGDPNSQSLTAWPAYDATAKRYLDFTNDGPIQKSAIQNGACSPYFEEISQEPHPLLNGNSRLASGYGPSIASKSSPQ